MHNVVVVGDANVDIIVPYPRFRNKERTLVDYPEPSLLGGGTSANTAVALARLGVGTSLIGTIGEDQYGRYIKNDLLKEGVDISDMIVEPELNTVGVFAFIDEYGERYLWGWPREHQSFKELDAEKVSFQKILKADWVHSSGMCLAYDTSARETVIRIFKECFEAGIPTSFDLNLRVDNGVLDPDYEKAVREIIGYTTYLLGSGTDEFAYLGEKRDWRKNAKSFVTDSRAVIVRNGKEGSYGFSAAEEAEAPAFQVTVEDTVGAGDVYNAGFISAVLEGRTLRDCLSAGNAVSGYTVERKGARTCPDLEQLKRFLEEHQ
ncbi:carbohydrate kinase family protein [Anaerostipes sp.]|uniref:carbohydrate kinase family protein n=1 Tax=Anaerostipes sp. TaxID=1872530 RepID=UPI0025C5403B|nr:carbohydrate kinase family protein [Anaerostipes sp.]MBS7008109.1 carbohydrate kinase family protein [Anaerostipes sp.]